MLYALYNIQLMRPIFHLYGHIALKFNIESVCDVFLKTLDLKSLPISNGNSIFASKRGKILDQFQMSILDLNAIH